MNDKLPDKMCLNCISEMNQAFAFKQKCERSERTLRLYLEQVKSEAHKISPMHRDPIELEHSIENVDKKNEDEQRKSASLSTRKKECEDLEIESNECHVVYQATDETINHRRVDEQTESQLKLPPANETTTENAVTDFIAENTLNFICSHCKASFSSRRSLSLHFNSRKCLQRSYECDDCHKIFIKKRYLIRHLQRMHNMQNERSTAKSTAKSKSKSKDKRKFKCHLCPKGETILY